MAEKECPLCGDIRPRTVACPWCHREVTIAEEPKDFAERAIEQIFFAGGMFAMIAVCLVGLYIAFIVVCLPFGLAFWLLKDVSALWCEIGFLAVLVVLGLVGFINNRGKRSAQLAVTPAARQDDRDAILRKIASGEMTIDEGTRQLDRLSEVGP
jgi:hypothetical protein